MKNYAKNLCGLSRSYGWNSIHGQHRQKAEWVRWIHQAANWTVAATLTFKRVLDGRPYNAQLLESALRHYLYLVDRDFFSRGDVKRGKCVESVVILGYGAYQSHPHAHIALAPPVGSDHKQVIQSLNRAADRTKWIHRERHFDHYSDSGWIEYMVDHDHRNLILPLFRSNNYTQLSN